MNTQELITEFEKKSKVILNSVNFKGEWRIIRESDWQKLKEKHDEV